MNAWFGALGRGVVRFRWLVVVLWLAGTLAAVHFLPSLGSQVDNNNSAFLPQSAPSNQAARLAEPLIGSISQSQIPVVATTTAPSLSAADQAALVKAAGALRTVPTVRTVQFLAESPNRKAVQLLAVSTVSPFDQAKTATLVDGMQAALDKLDMPADLQVHLAGPVATNVANQDASNRTGNRIQVFSILFIIVLLLVIFRSVLAPLVTLLPAVVVLQLAGALIGGLGSAGLKISGVTQLLLIVLVLGAGTDYGLFLVFRVREELLGGREPTDAVQVALARVGESITASAATVVVALLSLLLASFGIYHDLGAPLAVGIVVMLAAGLTLLPALLAILGRAVFWPSRVAPRPARDGLWGRVAGNLVRRPRTTLAAGIVVFGALALFVLSFKPGGFGGAVSAPAGSSAAAGNQALVANFPQASENPTNLLLRFPTSIWTDPSVLATGTAALEQTGSFSALSGPLNANGTTLSASQLQALHAELGPAAALAPTPPASVKVPASLYQAYRATVRFVSADGSTVQWEAGLKAGDPASTAALAAIPQVRRELTTVAHRVGASANGVAGEAAALYDVSSVSDGDLHRIVPLAVLAIGIVLALVLRSLVAPLYLILSVVLSYLASLGLAVIVFMVLGGQAGITFVLPFLMFLFLLALGEDYNILVMTRIREEARGRPLRQAVVRAVGATGPTVTSAGLVLAGSFAVLAIASGGSPGASEVQAIGFGLAVGILLDTFVVRTVLVPSTVALLGRANWWPAAMGRCRAKGVDSSPSPSPSPSPKEER